MIKLFINLFAKRYIKSLLKPTELRLRDGKRLCNLWQLLSLISFSATKSSGVLGTSMTAVGLAIAWVDSCYEKSLRDSCEDLRIC